MTISSSNYLSSAARLRQLDFLRGLAIILVLLRHQPVDPYTHSIGWIGVDLFFVLSGFLVSGLLFKEYARFGTIKPGLFLIRRGFKIYPIYYLFYLPYLLPILYKGQFDSKLFFADMFFIQNYVNGWGYAYAPSWSLAVEEHFYFTLIISMLLAITCKWLPQQVGHRISKFEWIVLAIMFTAFLFRMQASDLNIGHAKRISMTHLRMDSLLAGVLISFWFHYRFNQIQVFFAKHKAWLLLVAALCFVFTPFQDYDEAAWVRIFGFTLIYIGFGIILLWFLLDQQINSKLNSWFSKAITDAVVRVGVASYAIYIIHSMVNHACAILLGFTKINVPSFFTLAITSGLSILIGWLITKYVESYFLALRNRFFPSRVN